MQHSRCAITNVSDSCNMPSLLSYPFHLVIEKLLHPTPAAAVQPISSNTPGLQGSGYEFMCGKYISTNGIIYVIVQVPRGLVCFFTASSFLTTHS